MSATLRSVGEKKTLNISHQPLKREYEEKDAPGKCAFQDTVMAPTLYIRLGYMETMVNQSHYMETLPGLLVPTTFMMLMVCYS